MVVILLNLLYKNIRQEFWMCFCLYLTSIYVLVSEVVFSTIRAVKISHSLKNLQSLIARTSELWTDAKSNLIPIFHFGRCNYYVYRRQDSLKFLSYCRRTDGQSVINFAQNSKCFTLLILLVFSGLHLGDFACIRACSFLFVKIYV